MEIFSDDDLDINSFDKGAYGGRQSSQLTTTFDPATSTPTKGRVPVNKTYSRQLPRQSKYPEDMHPVQDDSQPDESTTPETSFNNYRAGCTPARTTFDFSSDHRQPPCQYTTIESKYAITSSEEAREPRDMSRYIFNLSAVQIAFISTIVLLFLILINIHSSVGSFRSEIMETMNNYQMHLINLQNQQRLGVKEAKERERVLTVRMAKLEWLLSDLMKFLRPNQIQGVSTLGLEIDPPSLSGKQRHDSLLTLMQTLQTQFPNEPQETFLSLELGIGETMKEKQSRPFGMTVLIAPSGLNRKMSMCFAKKLGAGINQIWTGTNSRIPALELTHRHLLDAVGVATIDAELKNYFLHESGRAVIIRDFELVQSYEMLMMLLSFIDDDLVYESEATFIFTLCIPQDIYDNYNWLEFPGTRMTEETLKRAWKNVLTPDKILALLTQVARANILLHGTEIDFPSSDSTYC